MFDSLSDRLSSVFRKFSGRAQLNESNIQEGLAEVRLALLEADVNVSVVRQVVTRIREDAVGATASQALDPSQQVEVLGGNQSNSVNIMKLAKARCIAIRWPKGVPVTGAPVRMAGGNVSVNEA